MKYTGWAIFAVFVIAGAVLRYHGVGYPFSLKEFLVVGLGLIGIGVSLAMFAVNLDRHFRDGVRNGK